MWLQNRPAGRPAQVDAFQVDRRGEAERFQPFRELPRRMLLWHGSRMSNFVGILSQGLRVAPPEAPPTGDDPPKTHLMHALRGCMLCGDACLCGRGACGRLSGRLRCGAGYMFGKGIYFADLVSKSAQYCFATPQQNTGLLLLCEVSIGNYPQAHVPGSSACGASLASC